MDDALRLGLLAWLLGVAGQPLAARLWPATGGAGLGRPLALLAGGLPLWWLAHTGVVPYNRVTAWLAVLAVLAAGAQLWRRAGAPRRPGRLVLGAEAVFLGAFALALVVVAHAADVVGTEKLMDQMLLSAVNASERFPPGDPWLAGETVNYYYLGHYLMAWLISVAGAGPTEGYNTAVALVFALAASAAYGAGALLGDRRRMLAGLAAAGLVCLGASIASFELALRHEGPVRGFDWFAASRVIPDTINDWPLFALVVGDLHAHYLAVPFTLLAAAAAFGTSGRARIALGAVCIGALWAINAWSLPVAAALFALALAGDREAPLRERAAGLGALLAGAILVAAPFWLTLEAGDAVGGLAVAGERSPPRQWLLVHGLVLAPCVLLVRDRSWPLAAIALLGLGCALVGEVVVLRDVFAGTALERLNTVFKFGFQAWLLLGLAGGVLLARTAPRVAIPAGAVLAAISLTGAVFLVAGRTDGLRPAARLDGLAWLSDGDRAAIAWIRDHTAPDAVVLEAAGPEYSTAGHTRIATFTGRRSLVGMVGHEQAWGRDAGERFLDVRRLYAGERRAALLRRHRVDYVVVGPVERATHPGLVPFAGLRRVFARGGTTIYATRRK